MKTCKAKQYELIMIRHKYCPCCESRT